MVSSFLNKVDIVRQGEDKAPGNFNFAEIAWLSVNERGNNVVKIEDVDTAGGGFGVGGNTESSSLFNLQPLILLSSKCV